MWEHSEWGAAPEGTAERPQGGEKAKGPAFGEGGGAGRPCPEGVRGARSPWGQRPCACQKGELRKCSDGTSQGRVPSGRNGPTEPHRPQTQRDSREP